MSLSFHGLPAASRHRAATIFWATESVVILDGYEGFLYNGSSSSLHAVWAPLDHISKEHADGVLFGARHTDAAFSASDNILESWEQSTLRGSVCVATELLSYGYLQMRVAVATWQNTTRVL